MPLKKLSKYLAAALVLFLYKNISIGQTCTQLGQTPSTAFPVCGTTTFHQASVPICATVNIFVPGCSNQPGAANYQNKNPYFYKFTCFTSGTLGFLISPIAANEDYDWQLWDITGHSPDDIFTNNSLVVTGNWAGTYGTTGSSSTGVSYIQCASDPRDNAPTFAKMPDLIAGHNYILMVSHFTDGQSGYNLSFQGGSAVITDPNIPHLSSVKADCDGKTLTVKLNKKVKCNSITLNGSEFSLQPAVTTVVAAQPDSCAFGFDFDDIVLTLASPVPNGNYNLVINNGSDGNTLLDNCDNSIPQGDKVTFSYTTPQPIIADSIGKVGCAPDLLKLYFPKKIACNSIAPDGTDFLITGPVPATIASASGNCVNGKTDYVIVKLSSPIVVKGLYTLTLKPGTDGNILIDECGLETLTQSLNFSAVDTVSADFQYQLLYGCRKDTLLFSHDGAHDVNNWIWKINNNPPVFTQSTSAILPATSTNNIQLTVSNGVCTDSSVTTIKLDNEVKASFTMVDFTCPEDVVAVTNTSTGLIDSWQWSYGSLSTSMVKDPPPFLFPKTNREMYYQVKLTVTNLSLGCTDVAEKTITVLDFCNIDVPTAFTPNNDGLNDKFGPHNALKADNYDFRVYNRWGQLIFLSKNWRDRWDGTFKNILQDPGVYVWMLSYTNRDTQQKVFKKGTVTLIR